LLSSKPVCSTYSTRIPPHHPTPCGTPHRYGLLNLLDEEVRMPQGSDLKWLAKCAENHASHASYGGPKVTQKSGTFLVRHYAGDV
jgi:myosin heavy subunit